LNGLAVQLMRESPRLVRALMAGQVLALTLTAALVPGALLLGAHRSELAELERRWLAWRLLPGR